MEKRYRTPSIITNDEEWKKYIKERLKESEKYHRELSKCIEYNVFEHSNIIGNELEWKIYLNEKFREAMDLKREETDIQKTAREAREIVSNPKKWRRYLYERIKARNNSVFT